MIHFSYIFFEAKPINILILISYEYNEKFHRILLNELQIFNSANILKEYVKEKNLKLSNKNNSFEQKILQNLINLINSYLSGLHIDLYAKVKELDVVISFDKLFPTDFSKEVMKYLIEKVNYGKVSTYSEIGEKIGSKAYRAVGNVMRNNQLPLIIPCHRVIRKNGSIGGYGGKMDNTWQQNLKKYLLKLEGSLS